MFVILTLLLLASLNFNLSSQFEVEEYVDLISKIYKETRGSSMNIFYSTDNQSKFLFLCKILIFHQSLPYRHLFSANSDPIWNEVPILNFFKGVRHF